MLTDSTIGFQTSQTRPQGVHALESSRKWVNSVECESLKAVDLSAEQGLTESKGILMIKEQSKGQATVLSKL